MGMANRLDLFFTFTSKENNMSKESKIKRKNRLQLKNSICFIYQREDGHPIQLGAVGVDVNGIYRVVTILRDEHSINKRLARIEATKSILSGNCDFYPNGVDNLQDTLADTSKQFNCFKRWLETSSKFITKVAA